MKNVDITKLNKTALLKHFEEERQEWLAAGMLEEDITLIHFGKLDKDGKPVNPKERGDYSVWLAERCLKRPDHKYAPGSPLSLESLYEGYWLADSTDVIGEVEQRMDAQQLFDTLTELQRICFIEVRMNGKTQAGLAAQLNISRESVKQAVSAAVKKLKKYF